MNEKPVLLDAMVFVYALSADAERRDLCREFLRRIDTGELRAYASVEMIQEVVHHRLRTTGLRDVATANGRQAGAICTLLSFDREVLDLSLDLIERVPTVRGRDAVHAATAVAYGIEHVVSADRAFDGIPGITRLDPLVGSGPERW